MYLIPFYTYTSVLLILLYNWRQGSARCRGSIFTYILSVCVRVFLLLPALMDGTCAAFLLSVTRGSHSATHLLRMWAPIIDAPELRWLGDRLAAHQDLTTDWNDLWSARPTGVAFTSRCAVAEDSSEDCPWLCFDSSTDNFHVRALVNHYLCFKLLWGMCSFMTPRHTLAYF